MSGTILSQFFLALALVLGCAKLFGWLARLVGQPRVVGEICAGLLASPMVLSPDLVAVVLPGEVKPLLSAVADIGLAAFMFAAGYELDLSMLYRRATGSRGCSSGRSCVHSLWARRWRCFSPTSTPLRTVRHSSSSSPSPCP